MTELRTLDLAFNSLSGYDLDSVPLLRKLSYLSLLDNGMIVSLPPSFESFPRLESLSLANNLLATNPFLVMDTAVDRQLTGCGVESEQDRNTWMRTTRKRRRQKQVGSRSSMSLTGKWAVDYDNHKRNV